MITLLSPAKTLDFDSPVSTREHSQPDFLDHAEELVDGLRQLSAPEIAGLMAISDSLSELNFNRFQCWQRPFSLDNARQALLAFRGDVYLGLEADSFDAADLRWAQAHLRILSGLYGLLRPLDLIQPYRLEMSTGFANRRGPDLYRFWQGTISDCLNRELEQQASPVVVNLASNEYFRVVQQRRLQAPVVTPVFRDWKNGGYKTISFYAKRARGAMARFLVQERLDCPDAIKAFTGLGYAYDPRLSDDRAWVFTRRLVAD